MTVTRKPDRRGEHEAAVKTIAQGKSDCLRWTCMLVGAFFVQLAHGTAGAACIRLSLRPLIGGAAEIYLHSSGAVRGEIAKVCLSVIARSEATKQSTFLAAPWIASLTLAMTVALVEPAV